MKRLTGSGFDCRARVSGLNDAGLSGVGSGFKQDGNTRSVPFDLGTIPTKSGGRVSSPPPRHVHGHVDSVVGTETSLYIVN